MSQLTDFLMIGMMGIGGLMIFFNWDQVKHCIDDLDACLAGGPKLEGNCTWNPSTKLVDWEGIYAECKNGKGVNAVGHASFTCTSSDKTACCNQARLEFLKAHPTPKTCAPPTGGCKPVNTGNCTYDCKGHFCWHGTSNTPSGIKTFTECNTNNAGANSNITTSCNFVRSQFCLKHSPDGKCTKGAKCPSGKVLGPNGDCIAGNVTNCDSGAKAWIARNANAFLGRMRAGGPGPPAGNDILVKWPSIIQSLSILNACSPIRLHINNATWCKQFAQLLTAIMLTYKMTLSIEAKNSLGLQYSTGRWYLGPWLGAGVLTFRGKLVMNPDIPYGRAYSTTLNGRENAYDPYGDQRYGFTLPKEGMKVKVAN